MKSGTAPLLAKTLKAYFTDFLPTQRAMSPHTVHSYRDSLKLLLKFATGKNGDPSALTVEQLTVDKILAFLAHLEVVRKNKVCTRNVRLAAIHSFFRYLGCQHPEYLEQVQRVLGVPIKRTETREVQHFEFAEIQAVMSTICRSTLDGRRDFALLTLLFNTGARVSEIVSLQAVDLRLTAPASLLLRGKGKKQRVCPLWPETAALLRELLEEQEIPPAKPVAVFHNHWGGQLTRFGVRLILRKYVEDAAKRSPSLKRKRLHPHSMRHYADLRTMPTSGLCRPEIARNIEGSSGKAFRVLRGVILRGIVLVNSEALEESQQGVVGFEEPTGAASLIGFGENLLFECQVGIEIDLGGLDGLMPQPKSDHRPINACLQ